MKNTIALHRSMDDLVFEGRNKAYGAFVLRRLYDKHMTRAMIVAILFFLLAVNIPRMIQMIRGFLSDVNEVLVNTGVVISEPPPIDASKVPPPPPPKVDPPPIQPRIKFMPPIVVPDDSNLQEDPPPPIDAIKGNDIGTQTMTGAINGVDPSLVEDPPSAGTIFGEPEVEDTFTYVEQMPSFPDGIEAMYKYINEMIRYTPTARENGIFGQVIVQFVVSKEGEIQNAKVIRGLAGGLNEEALRVINSMPKWKPGKHNGISVPVTFTLPIKFVLQ